MLVDSHCHLGDQAFAADRAEVVARAWAGGVGHLIVIGESQAATALGLELAAGEPRISTTAGMHPHDARAWTDDTARWLSGVLSDPRIVACGEIGLDYHYDHSPRPIQRTVFERQLELARDAGKPAVIHAREADADIAAILRAQPAVPVVLHSYSSGLELFRVGMALGHYVSFSGMVTFRGWELDEAVREAPLDRLLVETDAPYLAPVPFRGKRNEPAWVGRVAERVAEVRGIPIEELIAATGANARRLFGPRVGAA